LKAPSPRSPSPVCDQAIIKKGFCYPLATSPEYIDTAALDDGLGGGVFSFTTGIEGHALARAETALQAWRASPPTFMEVSNLQSRMANEYDLCFLASSPPNDSLSAPQTLIARTDENRSLLLREYVHTLSWQPPAVGMAVDYRIYDVTDGRRTLLAELPAGTLSFRRHGVDRVKTTIYAVLAVDATGTEGSPACVFRGQAVEAPVRTIVRSLSAPEASAGIAALFRRLGFRGAF